MTTTLKTWDFDEPQQVVSVQCRKCKTTYKDRQCRNDCVSLYPYKYPKKGYYWCENVVCLNCSTKKMITKLAEENGINVTIEII